MRKSIAAVLAFAMIVALALPVAASARGGQAASKESHSAKKAERSAAKVERKAGRAAEKEARTAEKEARTAEKAASKSQRNAGKVVTEAVPPVEGDETADSIEQTASVEATPAVGPGVTNAFSRITANLEKSLAKIEAGKKKQLPPGLVRVWLKFAGWLGVDTNTMPGTTAVEPTSTVEPTGTVEPTSTIEPTTTVEPTSTVDSPLDSDIVVTPTP